MASSSSSSLLLSREQARPTLLRRRRPRWEEVKNKRKLRLDVTHGTVALAGCWGLRSSYTWVGGCTWKGKMCRTGSMSSKFFPMSFLAGETRQLFIPWERAILYASRVASAVDVVMEGYATSCWQESSKCLTHSHAHAYSMHYNEWSNVESRQYPYLFWRQTGISVNRP